jgi:hypothetical protein
MCLYPKLINNPKYRVTKKNKGNVPVMRDKRVGYVPIGCGWCEECLRKKANEWKVRLTEDIKQYDEKKFVTLTFSDKSYTELAEEVIKKKKDIKGYALDNAIAALAVRRFLERWRKKYKKSLRHWLITELGHKGTENIHMHGILYTNDLNEVEKKWQYGFIWKGKRKQGRLINYVSERTINYMTKYVLKVDEKHRTYKSKIFASPGIGKSYIGTYGADKNKYKGDKTEDFYRTNSGHKVGLPIYYRNHIYTEEEREQLWLHKLDKNERWVMGHKIKADDFEEYDRLVKHFRKVNKENGYGSPQDWRSIEYEQQMRRLKQDERFERYKKSKEK